MAKKEHTELNLAMIDEVHKSNQKSELMEALLQNRLCPTIFRHKVSKFSHTIIPFPDYGVAQDKNPDPGKKHHKELIGRGGEGKVKHEICKLHLIDHAKKLHLDAERSHSVIKRILYNPKDNYKPIIESINLNLLYALSFGLSQISKLFRYDKKNRDYLEWCYYLSMPKIPGEVVNKIAPVHFNGRKSTLTLPFTKAVKIAIAVIKAIQNLHKLGFIHRDIKSGNIMYDEETDKAYLIDLSFMIPDGATSHPQGTPGYLPREFASKLSSEKPICHSSQNEYYSVGGLIATLFGCEYLMGNKEKFPLEISKFCTQTYNFLKLGTNVTGMTEIQKLSILGILNNLTGKVEERDLNAALVSLQNLQTNDAKNEKIKTDIALLQKHVTGSSNQIEDETLEQQRYRLITQLSQWTHYLQIINIVKDTDPRQTLSTQKKTLLKNVGKLLKISSIHELSQSILLLDQLQHRNMQQAFVGVHIKYFPDTSDGRRLHALINNYFEENDIRLQSLQIICKRKKLRDGRTKTWKALMHITKKQLVVKLAEKGDISRKEYFEAVKLLKIPDGFFEKEPGSTEELKRHFKITK